LEAAAALARHGLLEGRERLRDTFAASDDDAFKMEVVFILAEIGDEWSVKILCEIGDEDHSDEIKSACIWGLCFGGVPCPERAVDFLSNSADDVAMHATIGLAHAIRPEQVPPVIALLSENARVAACAAEVLARAPAFVVEPLLAVAFDVGASQGQWAWARFALGHHDEAVVREKAVPVGISEQSLDELAPLWRGLKASWLAQADPSSRLGFLARQAID
jgi:hypothetical protein